MFRAQLDPSKFLVPRILVLHNLLDHAFQLLEILFETLHGAFSLLQASLLDLSMHQLIL